MNSISLTVLEVLEVDNLPQRKSISQRRSRKGLKKLQLFTDIGVRLMVFLVSKRSLLCITFILDPTLTLKLR